MASLNLDLNYLDNVKTLRLVSRLGPGSAILPIAIWLYAGKHHPEDGKLALLEAELEHVCAWWGEKGAMVPALVEIGFLKKFEGFFQVNDWLEHSGHLAVFKKRAKNAAKKRWSNTSQSSNASSTAKGEPEQCPSSAVTSSAKQSTSPTPSSPSASSTAPANGTAPNGKLKPGHYDTPEDEIMSQEEFAKIKAALAPTPVPAHFSEPKADMGQKTQDESTVLVPDDVF